MADKLRVPRTRGAFSGAVLLVLGVWGALIPFIGPYLHFAYAPDRAWAYTSARLWLEIVPGAATAIGGLILLATANRALAAFAAWLAAVAGAWFVVGPAVGRLWASAGFPQIGSPVGSTLQRTVEQISFFTGLGIVIVFFAAVALGRLAVVAVRDAQLAAAGTGAGETAPYARTEVAARDAQLAAAGTGTGETAPHARKEAGMFRGFKNFLMQGDLIVIAVGLVVALAFSTLIKAFTDNIITPLVNAAGGGAAGKGLGWTLNGQRIDLGAFISAIVYFIIFMAVIYFLIVVPYRAYMRRRGTTVFGDPQPTKSCPNCKSDGLPIGATRCKYCASELSAVV